MTDNPTPDPDPQTSATPPAPPPYDLAMLRVLVRGILSEMMGDSLSRPATHKTPRPTIPTTPTATPRETPSRSDIPVRDYYTVNETMVRLGGISRATIYELINSGELRTVKLGGRRLVPAEAIHEIAMPHQKA